MIITDLEKNFSQFRLLIDRMVTKPGTIYGLIGPNGSGKTTALKVIAGLIKADRGKIDYEGLVKQDITMAPRKPYFIHDSVYKNLTYPLALRKIPPGDGLVESFLSLAGLSGREGQYAPSLSAGEQQKLSIARAMIFGPKLVLVDEAFSNLDMESSLAFEEAIKVSQKKNPATWIVISHQLANIHRLCSHVFFMDEGNLVEFGEAGQILFDPKTPKLKRYLQHLSL
ncbi:MAG: ABC transporter ATP-binding protein [Eubacteriaceae bacterium]|nr:ABC transporter ATP-binding protein [Eubacteriaceae bacterium]